MAREHDDHLFNPQSTKNISKVTLPLPRVMEYDLKVVKLTHSWPKHLNLFEDDVQWNLIDYLST